MRLIDADAAIDAAVKESQADGAYGYMDTKSIVDMLKGLPTAQPEIIRCKDCKYQEKEWREDKRFKDNGYWVYGCKVLGDVCGYWAWFGQDDEFCSDAERREDENGTD